jgi:hypothetical protein
MALPRSSSGAIMDTYFHLVIAKTFPVLLLQLHPILATHLVLMITEELQLENVNAMLIMRTAVKSKEADLKPEKRPLDTMKNRIKAIQTQDV